MMDFIAVPVVIGIVFYGVYKLFELFVCKSERLKIIDKLGDKLSASDISGKNRMTSGVKCSLHPLLRIFYISLSNCQVLSDINIHTKINVKFIFLLFKLNLIFSGQPA